MRANIQRLLFVFVAVAVFVAIITTRETKEIKFTENYKPEQVEAKEPEKVNIGEFILTAYCPCEICCEEYGENRPVDENGNVIVYGSTGERLLQGVSIAVDPKVIGYGSNVEIDGKVYVAQDCGGAIDGNRIDVYFDNHEDAWNFGVQTKSVYIIEG